MSLALRSSTAARHNLSAAPPPGRQQHNQPLPSPLSSARGGGETDRAYQAIIAAASPKATPARLQPGGGSIPAPSELTLDATNPLPPVTHPNAILPAPTPPPHSRKPSQTDATSTAAGSTGVLSSPRLSSPSSAAVARSPSSASIGGGRERRPAGMRDLKLTMPGVTNESKEKEQPTTSHHRSTQKRLELEEEIMEAKVNIQRKEEYIAGLQRNCETLSALCAKHMQQVTLLKADFDRVTLEKHLLESESHKSVTNEALTTKLLKENDELMTQRRQLTLKLDAIQTKVHTFQHQISELTDQKEDLTADLTKERSSATGLRQELEEMKSILNSDATKTLRQQQLNGDGLPQHEFEKKLVSLKHDHDVNRSALENLSVSYRTLQLSHTKLQNMMTRIEQEKNVLESDVARWKRMAQEARASSNTYEEQATLAVEAHTTLSETNLTLTKSNDVLMKRLPELEAALKASEKSRSILKKEHEILWSTKQDLGFQLEEAHAEAALLKKQIEILNGSPPSPASSSAGDSTAAGEVAMLQSERATLVSQLESLQSRFTQLETMLSENDTSLQRWKEKYETVKSDKSHLTHELEQAQQRLKQVEAELDETKRSSASTTNGHEGLQQSLTNATDALHTLEEKYKSQSTELDSCKVDVDRTKREVEILRSKITSLTDSHSEELSNLRKESETFVADRLSEQEKQLSSMQKSLLSSQHRTAELESILDQPRLSQTDLSKLAKREKELQATIAKLIVNEEASEASFTCYQCVGIFTKPVTCIPCGHSYCMGHTTTTHATTTHTRAAHGLLTNMREGSLVPISSLLLVLSVRLHREDTHVYAMSSSCEGDLLCE